MNTVINFCTPALGDSIAFSPYADEYQKIHGGNVYVKTKWFNIEYNTFFGSMFIFDSDFTCNINDIPEDNHIPIETAIYICKHAINKINSRTCIKHVKEIIVKETV